MLELFLMHTCTCFSEETQGRRTYMVEEAHASFSQIPSNCPPGWRLSSAPTEMLGGRRSRTTWLALHLIKLWIVATLIKHGICVLLALSWFLVRSRIMSSLFTIYTHIPESFIAWSKQTQCVCVSMFLWLRSAPMYWRMCDAVSLKLVFVCFPKCPSVITEPNVYSRYRVYKLCFFILSTALHSKSFVFVLFDSLVGKYSILFSLSCFY